MHQPTEMDNIKPLYDVIQLHDQQYSAGNADYSVTTLLDPPRVVLLNKRHPWKGPVVVGDMLSSFLGTAVHHYAEYLLKQYVHKKYKYTMEERLFKTIADRKISGAYDIVLDDSKKHLDMYDWKCTSAWKLVFGDTDHWTAQQNVYRYFYYDTHGVALRHSYIIALYLDWKEKDKLRFGKKYPAEKAMQYRLKKWTQPQTQLWLEQKVEALKDAEPLADDQLPECTYEDMWTKPDQYAVKANNRVKALRVLNSKDAARKWMYAYLNNPDCKHKLSQLSIETRMAQRTRCDSWCPVANYCNQYRNYLLNVALSNEEDN